MKYILVHGLGQDSSSWEEVKDELHLNDEINCPNIFKLCNDKISYNKLYKVFSEYCDTYSEPLNICGLSLGGILALDYAINNPKKINSLVLVGTQYRIPKLLMILQNLIFRFMPRKTFEKIGISKEEVIYLTKSMMNLNFEKDLEKIKCPTLIICGEKDKANIKASMKLKDLISKSTFKIIKNAGHEVNIDNPKLLGKELNDFWDKKEVKEIKR